MLYGDWDMEEALEVRAEEAMAMGEAKGILRAARQMKAEGMGFDVISRVTGLSGAEVERLDC